MPIKRRCLRINSYFLRQLRRIWTSSNMQSAQIWLQRSSNLSWTYSLSLKVNQNWGTKSLSYLITRQLTYSNQTWRKKNFTPLLRKLQAKQTDLPLSKTKTSKKKWWQRKSKLLSSKRISKRWREALKNKQRFKKRSWRGKVSRWIKPIITLRQFLVLHLNSRPTLHCLHAHQEQILTSQWL